MKREKSLESTNIPLTERHLRVSVNADKTSDDSQIFSLKIES